MNEKIDINYIAKKCKCLSFYCLKGSDKENKCKGIHTGKM